MVWFLNRNSNDSMVKLLNDYQMSLLRPPRENEAVGDLHVYKDGKTSTQGRIYSLLDPTLEMPPLMLDESLPNFSGTTLYSVQFQEGFSWFEGFLAALKVPEISAKMKLEYEKKQAKHIRFKFSEVTQDRVDVYELGARLEDTRLRVKNPFYDERAQYFLVTAVARSPSITIRVERNDGQTLSLGLDIPNIVENSTNVQVSESAESELIVRGKKLAFGVQTYQMRYDPGRQHLSFVPAGATRVGVKGKTEYEKSVIGGSRGNVFLDIEANAPINEAST